MDSIVQPSTSLLQRYAQVLDHLQADNLNDLSELLDNRVRFIDPFNDLSGKSAFIGVMREMFEKLDDVRFDVLQQNQSERDGWLYWRFSATSGVTGPFSVEGSSRIRFTEAGLVELHHDFWDASRMMQELPVFGRLIAVIRRRAAYSSAV